MLISPIAYLDHSKIVSPSLSNLKKLDETSPKFPKREFSALTEVMIEAFLPSVLKYINEDLW